MAKRPTLTKQRIVRTIGLQTGIRDTDVSRVIEALMDVVTAEIAVGGRLELQNFLVIEVQEHTRRVKQSLASAPSPVHFRVLKVRPGRRLRAVLQGRRGG